MAVKSPLTEIKSAKILKQSQDHLWLQDWFLLFLELKLI